jgi:SWI/SNF-related matrix-associated actin-dependent regulator 1 of chromatin subfamily A
MSGEVIISKTDYIVRIDNGPAFNNILKDIKALPGRRYDMASRSWSVKINNFTTNKLTELGFKIPFKADITKIKSKQNIFSDGDTFGLRPFQADGVQFIFNKHGRVLIGDEMGLGKTVQALAYLRINPTLRPALVVCPASLKLNWKIEALKWCPDDKDKIYVIDSKVNELPKDGITIINYELLKRFTRIVKKKVKDKEKTFYLTKKFNELDYKIMIIDEAHYIMNKGKQRTEITLKIGKEIDKIIALTGTPFMSRPIEIFNIANLLNPEIFDSKWRFAERYCDLNNDGYGWKFDGCNNDNTKELHDLLTSTIMIRRLKKDVLKELPPRQVSVVPLEIDNIEEYRKAEEEILNNFSENMSSFMVQCEYLKGIAMAGKFNQVIQRIKDFFEYSDEKLVIMAHHLEVIGNIYKLFDGLAVRFTGEENVQQKQDAIDRFQNDRSVRLFIGGIKAANMGITLTAASKMEVIEFLWTPGIHDQAGDRIHRIGQTQPVNIYYPIADGTIEVDLAKMLDEKRKNVTAILDGEEASKNTLLIELYNEFKRRVGK